VLLDQPIGELMHTAFLILPPRATVAEALEQSDPGQIIIIADDESQVAGILPEAMLSRLPDLQRPLIAYQEQFFPPTWTSADTLLRDALQGMMCDRSIRWHAVLTSGRIVGVVPPSSILQAGISAMTRDLPPERRRPLREYLMDIWGNTIQPPPGLCYRCAGPELHRVAHADVQNWDLQGRALCSSHGKTVSPENPCQGAC
jgi:hypothetical protein